MEPDLHTVAGGHFAAAVVSPACRSTTPCLSSSACSAAVGTARGSHFSAAASAAVGDGPRTPLIAVSPYSTGGRVVHNTYHVSILKFIERNWHLDPLTARSRDNLPNPHPHKHFVARINSRAQSAPRSDIYVRRRYSGRPSSSMRFSEAAAMATSVVCRPPVRERSASPITCL